MLNSLPSAVEKILVDQHLRLLEVLQYPDTKRRRFFNLKVVADASPERELVLKVFGRGDPTVAFGFEKEVGFLELVGRLGGGTVDQHLPSFIGRGDGACPWYLRDYIKGNFLGDICADFGIRPEFLTQALCEEFLDFFKVLRDLSGQASQTEFFRSLSPHGYDWYENDRSFYEEYIRSVSKSDFKLIADFLKARRTLLDQSSHFLVHGDLYLKNMFWDGRRLVVSDWELLHRGNLAFDFGFIWLLAFRSSSWRDQLLSGFLLGLGEDDRSIFEDLFRVVKLSLALRFIRHGDIMIEGARGEILANVQSAQKSHHEILQECLVEIRRC